MRSGGTGAEIALAAIPAAISAAGGIAQTALAPDAPKPAEAKTSMPTAPVASVSKAPTQTTLPSQGAPLQMPTQNSYAMEMLKKPQGGY